MIDSPINKSKRNTSAGYSIYIIYTPFKYFNILMMSFSLYRENPIYLGDWQLFSHAWFLLVNFTHIYFVYIYDFEQEEKKKSI